MTDVLFEAMRGSLDHCVKCTICETACPFSNVTPLFPGPKYVGPQAERFRTDEPVPDASVDYCSSCGICTQVCPQGVHIAEINTQAKARLRERDGVPLREQLIARPTVVGRLGTPAAPIANWSLRNRPFRLLDREGRSASTGDAAMPHVRRAARSRAWARAPPPAGVRRSGSSTSTAAGRTTTSRSVGEMAVAVLAHNGFAVDVPKQDCCGLPLQSNGMFDAARGYTRRLAKNLGPAATGDDGDRRHLDELHADAQARGEGDPRPGRRAGPRVRQRAHRTTSSSSCSSCTSAASCAPTSRPST